MRCHPPIGFVEFVALMAFMGGILAFATDAMLPVLPEIGDALGVEQDNDRQQVVFVFFLGMALSQVFYGPLADSFGRKPLIFIGLGLFIVGGAVAALATDFTTLLIGRAIQGVGVAGPRVVSLAVTRDRYQGREMARVSSLIMMTFIMVPVIAPAVGQAVAGAFGWRAVFGALIAAGFAAALWTALRLEETKPPARRVAFSLRSLRRDCAEALADRRLVWCTLANGCIFAPFLTYLSSAQQLLGNLYGLGDLFPLAFASLAVFFGLASLLNSLLVRRLGMRRLTSAALSLTFTGALVFLPVVAWFGGEPPLWGVMAFLAGSFFCIAMTFSNLNALAMEGLPHIAGAAASLIASLSTLVGLALAQGIGAAYNDTVYPFVIGFLACAGAALLCLRMSDRPPLKSKRPPNHAGSSVHYPSDA